MYKIPKLSVVANMYKIPKLSVVANMYNISKSLLYMAYYTKHIECYYG